MLLYMLETVANPRFCACRDTVYEVDKATGKELLALRDGNGKPVAELRTSSTRRPVPLKMNDAEQDVWEADGGEE